MKSIRYAVAGRYISTHGGHLSFEGDPALLWSDDYRILARLRDPRALRAARGLRSMQRDRAERYVAWFGGHITACINEPDAYPILIDKHGIEIGILM